MQGMRYLCLILFCAMPARFALAATADLRDAEVMQALRQIASPPPDDLDEVGLKIWDTLVGGNPHWSNWSDLMWKIPKDSHVREQLTLVTSEVEARLHEVDQEYDYPLDSLVAQRVYDLIHDTPDFVELRFDRTPPGAEILASFDEAVKARRPPMDYATAERNARADVARRYPDIDFARLQPSERREIQRRIQTLLTLESPLDRANDELGFELWRANEIQLARENARVVNDRMMNALIRNPDVFPHLTYARVTSSVDAQSLHYAPLSQLADRSRLPTARSTMRGKHDLPAAWRDRLEDMDDQTRGLGWVESSSQKMILFPSDRIMALAEHPTAGLIGIALGQKDPASWQPPDFAYQSSLGRAHQTYFIAGASYAADRDLFKTSALARVRFKEGHLRAQLLGAIAYEEAAGRDGLTSTHSPAWFRRSLSGDRENEGHSLYWPTLATNTLKDLYQWQIVVGGFDRWQRLLIEAQLSDLPRIEFQAPRGPEDSKKTVSLSKAQHGTVHIPNLEDQDAHFDVIASETLASTRFRWPFAEDLSTMTDAAIEDRPGSVRILLKHPIRLQRGSGVGSLRLEIPTPEGFRPTSRGSSIEIDRVPIHITFATSSDARTFAINLGQRARATINSLTIDFVRDPAPTSELKLVFDEEQLRDVRARLLELGAPVLAEALGEHHTMTAKQLAALVRKHAIYTTHVRAFTGDNWSDFVNAENRFELQCLMAARLQEELVNAGLTHHPWRSRVRLAINSSLPARETGTGLFELTTPGHAELDIFIDDLLSETLDATPGVVAQVPVESTRPDAKKSFKRLREEVAHERTQILNFLSFARAVPSDPSLPVLRMLRGLGLADAVLTAPPESTLPSTVAAEVERLLDRPLASKIAGDVGAALLLQLQSWHSDLERYVRVLTDHPSRFTRIASTRARADVMLGPAVTQPLARALGACEALLKVTAPRPSAE